MIERTDTRTLAQLCKEVHDLQNASNINVCRAMVAALSRLRDLFPNEGTAFFNRHPVMVLYADKLADMTGAHIDDHVSAAYTFVNEKIKAANDEPHTDAAVNRRVEM